MNHNGERKRKRLKGRRCQACVKTTNEVSRPAQVLAGGGFSDGKGVQEMADIKDDIIKEIGG